MALCKSCEKLNYQHTTKKCLKCTVNNVYTTLSVICDSCSFLEKKCSCCLKNIQGSTERKIFGGCGSCHK